MSFSSSSGYPSLSPLSTSFTQTPLFSVGLPSDHLPLEALGGEFEPAVVVATVCSQHQVRRCRCGKYQLYVSLPFTDSHSYWSLQYQDLLWFYSEVLSDPDLHMQLEEYIYDEIHSTGVIAPPNSPVSQSSRAERRPRQPSRQHPYSRYPTH